MLTILTDSRPPGFGTPGGGQHATAPWPPGDVPVRVAAGFWVRLIGLMFRRRPPPYALLIPGCRAVHTCFLRFPVTLVALDRQGQVIATRRAVPPWRVVVFPPGTWAVGEMA